MKAEEFYSKSSYPKMKDKFDKDTHRFSYWEIIQFAEDYAKEIADKTWDGGYKRSWAEGQIELPELEKVDERVFPDKETFMKELFENKGRGQTATPLEDNIIASNGLVSTGE